MYSLYKEKSMRYKKLFTSALLIATSLFLFTGCGEKAEPVSAEPTETINEVDTEESLESTEPSPSPTVEPTEEPVEENSESEVDTPETEENTENTSESTGIEIVEELDLQMYVQTSANARSGDSTDYEVVTTFSASTELHVTGRTANDWYRVEWGDGVVYIAGSLLGDKAPSTQQPSSGSGSGGGSSTTPPASNGQQTQPSSDITDEEIQKFLDEWKQNNGGGSSADPNGGNGWNHV